MRTSESMLLNTCDEQFLLYSQLLSVVHLTGGDFTFVFAIPVCAAGAGAAVSALSAAKPQSLREAVEAPVV